MSTVKRVSGDYTVQTINAGDLVTLQSTNVNIVGNLTVTGNAVLTGNINADKIFNGTTSVEIPTINGNITFNPGGVGNVMVVSPTGTSFSGTVAFAGNVDGANINTTGGVYTTNAAGAGNISIVNGNMLIAYSSNATSNQNIRFQDSNIAVTTLGSNIGAIEWFTNDATGAAARITARIRAVYEDTNGNANIQIQTGSTATPTTRITVIGSSGNVGIANAAPLHTLAVTGNAYVSTFANVVGNVNAGNLISANLAQSANVVVTGAISTPSWTTTGVGIRTVASTYTDSSTAVSGTATTNHIHVLARPTLAGSNATVTTTDASTLYIANSPLAGSNMTITNAYALYIAAGNTYSAGNVYSIANITGGNVNSDAGISATGNITGANIVGVQNVYTTGNVITANLNVSGNSSGSGIGVENIVWQPTTVAFNSVSQANVGSLGFLALAGYTYKYEAYLPVLPDGGTTTGFSTYFDAGTCYYTVEAQPTQTAAFNTSTSNVSGTAVATQAMTGTTSRTVRIQGTIYSAGNANVAIQAQTSASNINIQSGSYLTYTRLS